MEKKVFSLLAVLFKEQRSLGKEEDRNNHFFKVLLGEH
jgi:hypothetical protein